MGYCSGLSIFLRGQEEHKLGISVAAEQHVSELNVQYLTRQGLKSQKFSGALRYAAGQVVTASLSDAQLFAVLAWEAERRLGDSSVEDIASTA